MTRLQIPYRLVLLNPRDFDPCEFDAIVRDYVERSRKSPVVIEVFNDNIQYLLFINEGQLYWACASEGRSLPPGPAARVSSSRSTGRNSPRSSHTKPTSSCTIRSSSICRRNPSSRFPRRSSTLEELLERAEKDRYSAIVSARNSGVFFFLRYQAGKAIACYSLRSDRGPASSAREDFLVKVFTITAKRPLEINLFTDLAVTHAEDVRSIPPDYTGSISSFYLSQPPRLVVRLKGRPLKTYPFSGAEMSVGRLPENEIVIDNLSVSRKHAVFTSRKGGYALRDLGSKNGTLLNDKPVSEANLSNGDVIMIGKYEILFQIPTLEASHPEDLDQTVVIPHFRAETAGARKPACAGPPPRLFRKSAMEEYPLDKERIVIGRGKDSDIRLSGIFAPRVTVEVLRKGSEYVLQKIEGRNKVTINGEEMEERTLEKEDLIAIGSEQFVFKD